MSTRSPYFTVKFWTDSFDRVFSTFAQALGAYLILAGVGLFDADWKQGVGVAGMAGLLAFLKSVVRSGPTPLPDDMLLVQSGRDVTVDIVKPDSDARPTTG